MLYLVLQLILDIKDATDFTESQAAMVRVGVLTDTPKGKQVLYTDAMLGLGATLQVSDTDAVLDGTMEWEPEPMELTGA